MTNNVVDIRALLEEAERPKVIVKRIVLVEVEHLNAMVREMQHNERLYADASNVATTLYAALNAIAEGHEEPQKLARATLTLHEIKGTKL